MAIIGRQFNHLQELLDYLNDVIVSSPLEPTLDLDALTLIIDNGSDKTVTFSGTELTPNQIVAQINAVVSSAAALRNYGQSAPARSRVAFVLGSLIVKSTGTANALLGLHTSGTKTVGSDAVAKADIISITEFTNRYTVVHE